jgi:hypothetical protein
MAESRLKPTRRRLALTGLALGVGLMHAGLGEWFGQHAFDLRPQGQRAERIVVSYVRELSIEAPPARGVPARPKPPPVKRSARAQPVARAASAAAPEALAPEPVAQAPADSALPAAADAAASSVLPPDTPASPSTAAASQPQHGAEGPAFDWPVSTRLSYVLTGNYQGEIHGSGQVEWIRQGDRYQVHVDVVVGLSFAPLMSRRLSSEGRITPQGLQPQRFAQTTKQAFSPERAQQMQFEPGLVTLANGARWPAGPGVQDTASQFVQMTWAFGTQPERLRPGRAVEVPLALPGHVSLWRYEVGEEETLYTPFGALQAIPVLPRRAARAGGDLVPQMWFAPGLRYLPVRIRIHQDAETFVDLVIARKPELAAQ